MNPYKSSVTLSSFYSPSSLIASIFKPQTTFPQFFQTNLLDPNRIIYKFIDCSTNNSIRVFYYQLFKVCFQLKQTQLLQPRDYLKQLTTVILDDRFRIKCNQQQTLDTQRLNNSMFKPLIKEFFQRMKSISNQRFQDIICSYPILDNIFLNIFKTFLSDFKILKDFNAQMPSSNVLEQLANIFDLNITKIGKCYRFDEADIFCYLHNDKQLYVATQNKTHKNNIEKQTLNSNIPIIHFDHNKQNLSINSTNNITPTKEDKKKLLISTGKIIEEQQSSVYSESYSQSFFKKQPDEDYTDINYELSESSLINKCQIFSSNSKSAQSSLTNILQPSYYEPQVNYQDFTSTLVLQIIHPDYRGNIRAVKDRAKHRKAIGSGMI